MAKKYSYLYPHRPLLGSFFLRQRAPRPGERPFVMLLASIAQLAASIALGPIPPVQVALQPADPEPATVAEPATVEPASSNDRPLAEVETPSTDFSLEGGYMPGSGSNFELDEQVRSFDVPFQWRQSIPTAQLGQTLPPLLTPDGGIIPVEGLITLELAKACGAQLQSYLNVSSGEALVTSPAAIFYTCDGAPSCVSGGPWRHGRGRSLSQCHLVDT